MKLLILDLIAGRRKPGLAAIVRQMVRDHFRRNNTLRAHRYSAIKRCVLWASKHPLGSLAAVTGTYAAGIIATAIVQRAGLLPPREGQPVTPMELNGYVLGAQATLVGLVFPLVIAFVGLLNQGRASFASRLTIYLEDSAAIFVGISSLLLCMTVSAQLFFDPYLANATGVIVSAINVLWLAVNISALGYFVLRTIAFLHPARSSLIIKEYVANVAWRSELVDLVTDNRWRGAEHYGYLPKGDESDWQNKARASIWNSGMWTGGDPLLSRRLKKTTERRPRHSGSPRGMASSGFGNREPSQFLSLGGLSRPGCRIGNGHTAQKERLGRPTSQSRERRRKEPDTSSR